MTQDEARADDPERSSAASILKALHSSYGSEQFQAKSVEKGLYENSNVDARARSNEAWGAVIDVDSNKSQSKTIGKWLRAHKGQVFSGLKLIQTGKDRRGVWQWRVTRVS